MKKGIGKYTTVNEENPIQMLCMDLIVLEPFSYQSVHQNICIPKENNIFPRSINFPGNFLECSGPPENSSKTTLMDFLRNSTLYRGQDHRNLTHRSDFMDIIVSKAISPYLETLICSHFVNF